MKITFIKNNLSYDIDNGFVYDKTYNETLDSATIRISHLPGEISIEPYDRVILNKTGISDDSRLDSDIYMLVDTYTQTMDTVFDEPTYSYEISLFSETKGLEGTILPNLSITKSSKSIYSYLLQYLDLYSPKIRVVEEGSVDPSDNVFINKYSLLNDPSFISKFNSVICPEFQWNTPTLREVLTDLMMVVDCIPTVKNNVIYAMDLTQKNDDIEYRQVDTDWQGGIYNASLTLSETGVFTDIFISVETQFKNHYHRDIADNEFIEVKEFQLLSGIDEITDYHVDGYNIYFSGVASDRHCTYNLLYYVKRYQKSAYDYCNYITKSQSSSDYATELQMNMQNVVEGGTITTTEFLTFTTDNYVMTTNNVKLTTEYPILKIKHLWLCFTASFDAVSGHNPYKAHFLKYDLCNLKLRGEDTTASLVYEQKEYETLKVLYRTRDINDIGIDPLTTAYDPHDNIHEYYSKFQNYCVYYTRGGRDILGFSDESKYKGVSNNTLRTYQWLMKLVATRATRDFKQSLTAPVYINVTSGTPHLDCLFQIEYETTANSLFRAGKTGSIKNEKVVMDNQTNSWVNAERQGELEYQKANRLGNPMLMINQRLTSNYDKKIKIGDFYEDYIVYDVQYQIFNDHIEVNAQAAKDYILKNYWTGIQSKVRSWVNARDEAFERIELDKYYCEFSFNKKDENLVLEEDLADYCITPLTSNVTQPIKYCGVRTKKGNNYYPSKKLSNNTIDTTPYYYAQNVINRQIGNSIVLSSGFSDNWYAGKSFDTNFLDETRHEYTKISDITMEDVVSVAASKDEYNGSITGTDGVGGNLLNNLQYTNEEGEFDNIEILYAPRIKKAVFDVLLEDNGYVEYVDDYGDRNTATQPIYYRALVKPAIIDEDIDFLTNVKFRKNKLFYKDNREIPRLTTQFEFCSDTDKIAFTKYWVANQEMIRSKAKPTVKIYRSETWNKFAYPSDKVEYTGEPLDITPINNITTSFKFIEGGGWCYYIGDENNMWLAVDLREKFHDVTVFLNILKSRNYDVYQSQENQVKVGTIIDEDSN